MIRSIVSIGLAPALMAAVPAHSFASDAQEQELHASIFDPAPHAELAEGVRPLPGAIRERMLHVRWARLDELADGLAASLSLDLFDDTTLTAAVERVERRGPVSYSIFGSVDGDPNGTFVIVREGAAVVANVVGPEIGSFAVRSAGGGAQRVGEVDGTTARCGTPDEYHGSLDVPSKTRFGGAPFLLGCPLEVAELGAASLGPIGPGPAAGNGTVDVCALYTAGAKSAAGGTADDMTAEIHLAFAEANTALQNAGAGFTFRMVGRIETNYSEASATMTTHRVRLQTDGDGHMDEVHYLRTNMGVGADLACLFVDDSDGGTIAGNTLIPFNQAALDTPTIAFSVVAQEFASLPNQWSLGHELAHNFGMRHDWYPAETPILEDYARGHLFTGNSGTQWQTMMGNNTTHTRIQHFSSPNVWFDGARTGVWESNPFEADAREHLDLTCPTVAGFAPTVIDHDTHAWRNPNLRYDVDNDGRVVPLDVLRVIIALHNMGTGPLTGSPSASDYLVDVSGDDYLSPIDALIGINFLNLAY